MATPTTQDADANYLIRQSMNTGYQFLSVLTPPLYTTFILMKRGRGSWSLNRLLRATWVGGLTGMAAGGGIAYGRYKYSTTELVHSRRLETKRIRSQDHSTIGAVLMALLTPALFWNRASIVNLILGGAGLGSAIGTLTHHVRTLTGDPPPRTVAAPIVQEQNTGLWN